MALKPDSDWAANAGSHNATEVNESPPGVPKTILARRLEHGRHPAHHRTVNKYAASVWRWRFIPPLTVRSTGGDIDRCLGRPSADGVERACSVAVIRSHWVPCDQILRAWTADPALRTEPRPSSSPTSCQLSDRARAGVPRSRCSPTSNRRRPSTSHAGTIHRIPLLLHAQADDIAACCNLTIWRPPGH